MIQLRDCQRAAVQKMHNGCILCGGVGSGKSRTSLSYYYIQNGGNLENPVSVTYNEVYHENDYVFEYTPMDDSIIKDLYVITTARKRDTLEWEGELIPFLLSTNPEHNGYKNKVVIDSWNNISKYAEVTDAFFIFDEQRVVGKGAWVKSFLKIAKSNQWILLSATPGDKYEDYIPVFIANGFYKNRTEFSREHLVYSHFTKFPKVERYINTGRLIRLRDRLLVDIDYHPKTVSHHEDVWCDYDILTYKGILKNRRNIFNNDQPIKNVSELCQALIRVTNSDESRSIRVLELFEKHPKAIIFYNYDYELEILKNLAYGPDVEIAEWNGHAHQPIPECDSWVYLVQYNAGAEGWNCITTDTIIFYSQNYSYRIMEQARGRIDRMNTPFDDLYFYHLKSHSGIDLAISRALKNKKKFNESMFASKL